MKFFQLVAGILVTLSITALIALIIKKQSEYIPKFIPGDCVIYAMGGNEFEAPKTVGKPVKILEVGKERYKTTNNFTVLFPDKEFLTELITTMDDFYIKVDCGGL